MTAYKMMIRLGTGSALLASLLGCAHSPAQGEASARPRTCLVLSVGGAKAIAEIGAVMALRDAGIQIDCIAGNSMGAVVSGLFATAPGENLLGRFRTFRDRYLAQTRKDVTDAGFEGGLVGALIVAVTGGAALPLLAAVGVGSLVGAGNIERRDRDRMVRVLDDQFQGVAIENLNIPYVTFYQQQEGDGLRIMEARKGNLARSIGRSIANPFVFENLDVRTQRQLDPGSDRLSAVPVEDTCRVFPGHRLIAINVTDQPLMYSRAMTCPVEEVAIGVGHVDARALFSGDEQELERVVQIGRDAIRRLQAVAKARERRHVD